MRFIWPRLRMLARDDALLPLAVPRTFRFVGLNFLVPGVVSPSGGFTVQLDARTLGAAFFIPTVVVPPALVTHGLMFWLLTRSRW
jgi:hypothetical protein